MHNNRYLNPGPKIIITQYKVLNNYNKILLEICVNVIPSGLIYLYHNFNKLAIMRSLSTIK